VVFRLPTEAEWILAANGGNVNRMYPWSNYYLRNRKGEFLCNFLNLGDQSISYDKESKTYKIINLTTNNTATGLDSTLVLSDIAFYLSTTLSFYPSPTGFYNISGNAAEMVAEKGLAKGGSYNDPGYDVRISSKKQYEGPSPEIGFRVAMEIIER
jgi:formylglycine-generating enzyme required for sulfatase activity